VSAVTPAEDVDTDIETAAGSGLVAIYIYIYIWVSTSSAGFTALTSQIPLYSFLRPASGMPCGLLLFFFFLSEHVCYFSSRSVYSWSGQKQKIILSHKLAMLSLCLWSAEVVVLLSTSFVNSFYCILDGSFLYWKNINFTIFFTMDEIYFTCCSVFNYNWSHDCTVRSVLHNDTFDVP